MPYNDPPVFAGLELIEGTSGGTFKGQWVSQTGGDLNDNVNFTPQLPSPDTLDPLDALPASPLPGWTGSEPEMPALPWIYPPTGSPFGSPPLLDLDPHPDYYAIHFQAVYQILAAYFDPDFNEIRESAGINLSTPFPGGSYSSDTTVTPPFPHSEYFSGDPGWKVKFADGGWLRPATHDLDPTITPVMGDEGTDILWPWTGTFPTIDVVYSGQGSHVTWSATVFVTPYWLTERPAGAGLTLSTIGRGVRLVGGTLRN